MYGVKIFMKCMHVCVAETTYFLIEPGFPCLADEIAKPRPDMNIKVTAFTESKKLKSYIIIMLKNVVCKV